ncbi:hypothetical protein QCN29_08825 [Streptomyces sp. HNM0663]|uniref:Uncharacterized protein n=1 Tax=Streptomyces chengmaiensis TaxID=3040919 RepID=A0ABT6HJG6_9ACTN|nr:hypothetical protein [Streptomyces chengmaiensis]MDH2388889.1 hypothetical protein [Streptomyces chengmaiensis]
MALDPVVRAQLRGRLLQAAPAAGDQHQAGAAGGESAGELDQCLRAVRGRG